MASDDEKAAQRAAQKRDWDRRARAGLSNSFSVDEVRGVIALFETLLRGGDARQVVCSAPCVAVLRKFQAMEERNAAARRFADEAKAVANASR